MRLGAATPSAFYLGSSLVSAIYLGATPVWTSGTEIPPSVATDGSLDGRTLTVETTLVTGIPAPSLSILLTANGTPVAATLVSPGVWTYVTPSSAEAITLAWTVTAANGVSPNATSGGSIEVAADLAPALAFSNPDGDELILTTNSEDPLTLTTTDGAFPERDGVDVISPADLDAGPLFLFPGQIDGTNNPGDTIFETVPALVTWRGDLPPPVITRQWVDDNVPIPGATGTSLVIPNSPGSVLSLVTTATGPNGSRSVTSNTIVVGGAAAAINSVTYDTAGFVVDYTGTLSVAYDTAGILQEVE